MLLYIICIDKTINLLLDSVILKLNLIQEINDYLYYNKLYIGTDYRYFYIKYIYYHAINRTFSHQSHSVNNNSRNTK